MSGVRLRPPVRCGHCETDSAWYCADCWGVLLAELRAESAQKALSLVAIERDELKAELERLRAEVDSTKAALIDAALIQERDELKARLAHAEADAEQAIHNEAFAERQRIVAYIHARLAHATLDDRVSMRERGVMIDLGNAIERGEHE